MPAPTPADRQPHGPPHERSTRGSNLSPDDARPGPHAGQVRRRIGATTVATLLAGAALLVPASLGPVPAAGAAATDHTYHCTSLAGSSDSTYTIGATAPAQVVQGTALAIDPLVVTGTPAVDRFDVADDRGAGRHGRGRPVGQHLPGADGLTRQHRSGWISPRSRWSWWWRPGCPAARPATGSDRRARTSR